MVFEPGYNRREDGLSEYSYFQPVIIDPKYTFKTLNSQDDNNEKSDTSPVDNHDAALKSHSEENMRKGVNGTKIKEVYDTKNQLSSLIRNAKENSEILKVCNEHKSGVKKQSKDKYGW